VFRSASAGVTTLHPESEKTTTQIDMGASLEMQNNEVTKQLTKGKTMRTETVKNCSIRIKVKALAFVVCAGLTFAIRTGLT
jgi:hypothetical protein